MFLTKTQKNINFMVEILSGKPAKLRDRLVSRIPVWRINLLCSPRLFAVSGILCTCFRLKLHQMRSNTFFIRSSMDPL
jgi:hypothetical protein